MLQISELQIDYTNCLKFEDGIYQNVTCANDIRARPRHSLLDPCKCLINFTLENDFVGDVFMYYGLTNFYQNHRRYVKSRDDAQLLGEFSTPSSSDCLPFSKDNKLDKWVVPCGAIANSLFNDTLKLSSESHGPVPVENTGIAWPSDKEIKFRNPSGNLEDGKLDISI